jgi:hypothetical protein
VPLLPFLVYADADAVTSIVDDFHQATGSLYRCWLLLCRETVSIVQTPMGYLHRPFLSMPIIMPFVKLSSQNFDISACVFTVRAKLGTPSALTNPSEETWVTDESSSRYLASVSTSTHERAPHTSHGIANGTQVYSTQQVLEHKHDRDR